MLNWLKNKLRKWLLETNEPPSRKIEVTIDGKTRKVIAKEVVGLHLLCNVDSDAGELISADKATDTDHFWSLWEDLGGSDFVWEDGSPFVPPI